MRTTGVRAALAAAAGALILATVALAAPVTVDDVAIDAAGGDANFQVDNLTGSCPGGGDCVFTINDASAFGNGDAFDGGLVLAVGGRAFADYDGTGNLVGQELRTGPTKLVGVKVKRTDRGLPGSPTLRTLIKLKNTTRKAIRRRVVLGSALGSDSDSEVVRSSSGNRDLEAFDRWAITSDEPLGGSPGDPPVTFVHYGKGDVLKPVAASLIPSNSDSFAFAAFRPRLEAKQTRFLLFYTELADEHADAFQRVRKFNRAGLNNALKAGLSKKVQRKILNWDLLG